MYIVMNGIFINILAHILFVVQNKSRENFLYQILSKLIGSFTNYLHDCKDEKKLFFVTTKNLLRIRNKILIIRN